ncbi:MAG: signal peptidase I [Chloroflexota bacterium]|nr:signal peptidase I [Chloroflexota bacterium]
MVFVSGHAEEDGAPFRGWLVGHFASGPRHSQDVEVRWAVHGLHELRPSWGLNRQATTLSLLVRGRMRYFFEPSSETVLSRPGDYVLWGPNVAHRWRAELADTIVLTVRWPSRAGDAVDVDAP